MTLPAEELPELIDVATSMRVLARLARLAEQACQGTGISLPQYRLLVSISDQRQRPCELAARVGVSRPTLTALVDGLERHGLLRRAPVPKDRRGILLEPTPAGAEAAARAEKAVASRLLQLVDVKSAAVLGEAIRPFAAAIEREGETELDPAG